MSFEILAVPICYIFVKVAICSPELSQTAATTITTTTTTTTASQFNAFLPVEIHESHHTSFNSY